MRGSGSKPLPTVADVDDVDDVSSRGRAVVVAASIPDDLRAALEAVGLSVERCGSMAEARELDAAVVLVTPDALVEPAPHERRCVWAVLGSIEGSALVTLASRAGIDAIVTEPLDEPTVRWLLSQALPDERCADPGAALPSAVVGESAAMSEVWRLALTAARCASSVLITGETGTGKEVVARTIHRYSSRRFGPFVAINCAALPETLMESELFGHERGAFTGASARRAGRFELADGGTLFLDEVGELPPGMQAKLLRALSERAFERLGGSQTVRVDVRVVAATNRDLRRDVATGRFRADLLYRLEVLSVHVPPLRERGGDLLALFDFFAREAADTHGEDAPVRAAHVSADAERALLRHPFPGNVRELWNVAQHAIAMSHGGPIEQDHLPSHLRARGDRPIDEPNLLGRTLRELERLAILQTHRALGSVRATAEALGVSPRKVHYRLREYRDEGGLEDDAAEPGPSPRPTRILLAEDDDELRWALAESLEGLGYEVEQVSDGRGLLERLALELLREPPSAAADVIVSDVRMPGVNGMQILESLRSRGSATPFVLISAFVDDGARERASALGATALLEKPIDLSTLRRTIDASML